MEQNKNPPLMLNVLSNAVKYTTMGGDISVNSEYGKGSKFTIILPQKISSSETLGATEEQEEIGERVAKFSAPGAEGNFTVIEIDGVDVEKGISMMNGTVKSYLRALAVFQSDGIRKVEEIKKSLETQNYPLYTIHVHALKSATANIGANELSEAAKQLEMAGKQGDFEFIKLHSTEFLTSFQALLDNISVVVAANIEELGQSTDREALRSGLVKLKEAFGTMDQTAIDEAAKALRVFTQAFDVGFDVEVIVQDALIGEYEEAKSMIDKLLL